MFKNTNGIQDVNNGIAGRDGEYARRTVDDIAALIGGIRKGFDHDREGWFTESNGREDGQYGHTPEGPMGKASLQDFITAGEPGVAVLVKARGISRGIADATRADLEAIRQVIGEIRKYRDKAMQAKTALEDEADRLVAVEVVRLIGPDVFQPVDPNDPDGPSQRVLGGSEKVKRGEAADLLAELETLQDANSDQDTIDAEAMEIARLEDEKTRLEGEKTGGRAGGGGMRGHTRRDGLGRLVGAHPSSRQPLPGARKVWQGLERLNRAVQVRDALGERGRE